MLQTSPESCSWFKTALIVLGIVGVVAIYMPTRDEYAEQEAAEQIYRECMPKDGQSRVIRNHGGNIDCGERHVAMGVGHE